jgi:hypothetical protein
MSSFAETPQLRRTSYIRRRNQSPVWRSPLAWGWFCLSLVPRLCHLLPNGFSNGQRRGLLRECRAQRRNRIRLHLRQESDHAPKITETKRRGHLRRCTCQSNVIICSDAHFNRYREQFCDQNCQFFLNSHNHCFRIDSYVDSSEVRNLYASQRAKVIL